MKAERASVVWGGDVVLARRQHYLTQELGSDRILSLAPLREADLAIVNLECVVATAGEQGVDKGEGGPYYYRARPDMLRVLADAGIHAVATANNHSGDYGREALLEQINWLRDAGFASAGTGVNSERAFAPVYCRAGNLNVALFSVDSTQASFAATDSTPGTAYLPLNEPARWIASLGPLIAKARQTAHVVLIAVHWGPNYVEQPSDAARRIGRLLVELGADAVLGASAHVLQGIEIYRGRPIIYDAGNLLFDAIRDTPDDCGLFRFEISRNGVEEISFVPLAGHTGHTIERHGDDALAACQRYAAKCLDLGTSFGESRDGRLSLPLAPEQRQQPAPAPVQQSIPSRDAIPGHVAVSNLWQMASVPEDARCEPVSFGHLTLRGMRVWPKLIQKRQMLWVESFWSTDQEIGQDLRIELRAVPVRDTAMRPWGERMDHDPCDWLMPTSRWAPGTVYRDLYGLRPPQIRNWDNVDLQVAVRVVSKDGKAPFVKTAHIVRLDLPDRGSRQADAAGAASASSQVVSWSAQELADITGGTWLVPPPAGWQAKSFDFSVGMTFNAPSLYVAYSAEDRARHEQSTKPITKHWDRHDDLPDLMGDRKICGAMVSRPVPGLPADFPLLLVPDPLGAALKLGRIARDRFSGPVIGVTGTVGKSSTVAMVATMLGKSRTLTTQGNFNTRVGSVLALSNLNTSFDAAVLEIAQSSLWMNAGPITRVIKPTAAIVTLVELSQPGPRLKSVEDVAEYKSRIFDGLTGLKLAVLPDYIKYFDKIRAVAEKHAARTVIFGYGSKAEVRIRSITGGLTDTTIELELPTGPRRLTVPVLSKGMAETAAGAFTMLYAMGHDLDEAQRALAAFEPEKGRMQRRLVSLGTGGQVEILDDSFNAEVTSMINAFQLVGRREPGPGGRRIAILGRIGLLGDMTKTLHGSLAEPLLENKFQLVATHGPEMIHLRERLPPEVLLGPHFSDAASLVAHVAPRISAGDLVLIKGEEQDTDFGLVPKLLLPRLAETPGKA